MATSTQTDISIGWLSPTKYWKGICGNRIDPICISIQTSRVSWEPIGSCLLCVCARVSDGLRIHSSALLIEFLIAMQASALGRGRGSFR